MDYGKPKPYKGEVKTGDWTRDRLVNRPYGIGESRKIDEHNYKKERPFLINSTGFWKD